MLLLSLAPLVLIGEHSSGKNRGYSSSFAQLGSPAGTLIANAVVLLTVTLMGPEDFPAWGWRLPFAVGAILLIIGFYVRHEVDETPVFKELARTRKVAKSPVIETFASHGKSLSLAIGATAVTFGGYYLFTTICLAYLASTHARPSIGLYGTIIGAAVALPIILLSGHISDKIGRRPMYLISSIGIGIWAWVAFALINSGSTIGTIFAIAVGLALWAIAYGVQGALLPELFPAEVRYSGASLAYQITGAAGGLLPLVAASLMQSFGSTVPVASLVLGTAVVSLVAIKFCPETAGR